MLSKVAQRLQEVPHRIEVRGHTDSRADQRRAAARYPTNWELAGARAASVVRVLAERGVDPTRWSPVSLGETVPIATNDTPEGRQQNRRIEIRARADAAPAPADALRHRRSRAPPEASAAP